MKVKLFVRNVPDGFVADIEIPPFQFMPEIIIWGDRGFVRSAIRDTPDYFGYTEGFCYVVPLEAAGTG